MEGKILIVDDQYGIRVLLHEVFQKKVIRHSKREWISSFRYREKDNPDLVVLDMKIPGMDGIEILKHVKEIDESIKVILMTAYGELDMIQEAKDLGALMHFAKPFDIDEIRQAVRNELAVEA